MQEKHLRELHVGLDLSETGAVSRVNCAPGAPANICAAMVPAVQTWRFAPARRDGQPFASPHRLGLTLTAVPAGDSYRLRVDKAELTLASGALFERMTPPPFPASEARRGQGASVTALLVHGDAPDFKPSVAQVWVNGELAGPGNPFRKAMMDAIRSWKPRPRTGPPVLLDACIVTTFNPDVKPMPFVDLSPCKQTLAPGVTAGALATPIDGVFLN